MSDAGSATIVNHASANAAGPPVASNVWVAVLLAVLVGKMSEWVPGLAAIPLAKIAFLFAAVQAFRARSEFAVVRVWSSRIARPAMVFLTLSIVSVVFSVYKSNTLIESALSVIYLVTIALLLKSTHNERDLERLFFGMAGGAASLTLGTLLYFHGGRATINENFDSNEIAYGLDTLLPIVLALRVGRTRFGRLSLSAFSLAMILAVLLTGSRGGAIGLAVVVLLITAYPIKQSADGKLKRFSIGRLLVRSAVLGLVGFAVWGYLPSETQERLVSLTDLKSDYNYDTTSNFARTTIWQRDIALALERPIGYGMGSARAVDGMHGGLYKTAHNSLVQAFLELGALGLLAYLYTYYVCWRELHRGSDQCQREPGGPQRSRTAVYARALSIGLAGNFAAGFFLSQAYAAALWMTVAICAALVRVVDDSTEKARDSEKR